MEDRLFITKCIHGGLGLGRLADGMVAMLVGALPGETVRIRRLRRHRGHIEAELLAVLDPSPHRVEAPCPYYGVCGGCDLQHASYPLQLELKQAVLHEALGRAQCALAQGPAPTLASPRPFFYRHRLRLRLDWEGRLGFHERRSNTVAPVRQCLLASEGINTILAACWRQGLPMKLALIMESLELLQCPQSGRVIAVAWPRKEAGEKEQRRMQAALNDLDALCVLATDPKKEITHPLPALPLLQQGFNQQGRTYVLQWDSACFFQVNCVQNHQLVALALAQLAPQETPLSLLDLFCGAGNFSVPAALWGATVTGVEHNAHSIHWARNNCRAAGVDGFSFLTGNVEQRLHQLTAAKQLFDCILMDPPRQGLGKSAALLPKLGARRIVSISCDPASQARDLRLLADYGYTIQKLWPMDMFPQTHHIESLAILEKN